ncbi:MAG: hypothetical protein AAFP99_10300 [Pseudomonadota bacterium]
MRVNRTVLIIFGAFCAGGAMAATSAPIVQSGAASGLAFAQLRGSMDTNPEVRFGEAAVPKNPLFTTGVPMSSMDRTVRVVYSDNAPL